MRRGDIWLCDLPSSQGSEQSGTRPVVILQNDKGNTVSPVTTVIPLTSRMKHSIPTHVFVPAQLSGCPVDSYALVEQIRVVDQSRLTKRLGQLHGSVLTHIGQVLCKNLQIGGEQH